MKIVVVSNMAESLVNFRGPFLQELRDAGHDVLAVAPERSDPTIDALSTMGIRYRALPMRRAGIDPLGDIAYAARIVALLREERPSAVLAYTVKPVVYGVVAARVVGVPIRAALVNGLGYAFGTGGGVRSVVAAAARALYRLACASATSVIFQNPDDRAEFIRRGLVAERKTDVVAGSGIDLERFSLAPSVLHGPVYLMIARLIREKGVVEFVDAARAVKARHPSAVFRLLGPFDEAPGAVTRAEITAWESEGVVEYLGTTDDVRPILSAASVFVLPSYYREGTPRTALEAMATGRPVVTTDAPGCRETVRHGETGFLVPPRDPAALAESLERFARQPELIERMGRASRAYACEKYDVRRVNRQMRDAMGLEPSS